MQKQTQRLTQNLTHTVHVDQDAIYDEVSAGLLAHQASASPKYLYDALGSKLFEAICELPEYYPTRTEAAIFDTRIEQIASAAGAATTLIDLGAGNCAKAAQLFPHLQPQQYVAIDISATFLNQAIGQLQQRFPQIDMIGLGLDFSTALHLPTKVRQEKRLFFYPGSSIGNFTPIQATGFLRNLRTACGTDGALLIGVDLVKDSAMLEAAYDDALGVTAAFNLNLLSHLNRVLGADFHIPDWSHRAYFNREQSRIEMHLEAQRACTVNWVDQQRHFAQGERIHTENSYKYTQQNFTDLLQRSGFGKTQVWTDPAQLFMVCHAQAI